VLTIKKISRISIIALIISCLTFLPTFAKNVIPSGESIGIRLELNGLLVTDVEKGSPADASGLKKGDFVQNFTQVDEFFSTVQNGSEINITRNDKSKILEITAFQGDFGAKLQNFISGIGTLTYYDADDNNFYAIGHKVFDMQTGMQLPFTNGYIYKSKIAGINKGELGTPSELEGIYSQDGKLIGKVISNEDNGVIAQSETTEAKNVMETGKPIKGPASILTTINGDKVEEFSIEIENVINEDKDKNISIKVTDENLLAKTGGIAAGMSGSPIIQNGKLVGVVTHVSANEPQYGYGRTIEGD